MSGVRDKPVLRRHRGSHAREQPIDRHHEWPDFRRQLFVADRMEVVLGTGIDIGRQLLDRNERSLDQHADQQQ